MQHSPYGERDKSITDSRQQASAGDAKLPEAWQAVLSGRQRQAQQDAGGSLGFFLEVVHHDDAPAARLEAAPVWLTPRTRNQPAKASPLDSQQLARTQLTSAEQRLAASVLGLPSSQRKDRHYAHLNGKVGDALLTDMLDTTPCFLGGVAGLHLARGKSRTLAWHWVKQADGHQQLMPRMPHSQRLLIVGSLWYLDAECAELGMLQGSHDDIRLLDMPPLAPEQSAAFAESLAASPLARRLPAPHVFDTPRVIDASPRPVLALHALARPSRSGNDGAPLGYARLGFDYAGITLSARDEDAATVRRVRNGRLVDIQRRRAEELAAMEHLEACGLCPAVDTEGLPWDVAKTLPDDAWLFPGKGHSGALEVNTPTRWLSLRERFEQAGFTLDYASSFPFEVVDAPARWYASARDTRGHHRFELEVGVELDGERINLLPAVTRALHEQQFTLEPADNEADDP
ncbi:MAG TPA: ATP-dependent helicase, partial [Rhodanobacteraceae bacterium]|nr:ATP-dependent helicase [Rhodanobacteraceae bacterium]